VNVNVDDVEYILRIILKARDEMAAVLAKARTQLRGFTTDADKMNSAVTNLNQAMKNFDTNMDGITKKLQAWRAVLRDAGGDSDKTSKSLDSFAKSAERTVASTQKAARTQEELQQRARNLRKEIEGVTKANSDQSISTKFAISEYERLSKELDKLTLKMSQRSRGRTPTQDWAEAAQAAADRIRDIEKDITADIKKAADDRAKLEKQQADDAKRFEDQIVKSLKDSAAEQTKIHADRIAAIESFERRKATAQRQGQREEERNNAELAREAKRKATDDQKELDRQVADLRKIQNLVAERQRVEASVKGGSRDRSQVTRLAGDLDRLSKSYRAGSDEARHWSTQAAGVRSLLGAMDGDAKRASGSVDNLGRSLSGASRSSNRMGSSVAALDNQLRGLGLLTAVSSAQQLISAAIALGGELVSLASSAAMAGGALGGILAAGAAQALPVFGLLAGAMQRVKSVFDTFQQSQKLQQATFTDAEKAGQKQIDKTNQLANAQDTQAEAQDRLAESRKALTTAQEDGARQLEDLIYQEKAAALAAKGASLNVKEAQKALRDAVAGGASALEVQQRQQSLDEARQGAGRARVTATRATEDRQAVGGKVGNLDSVKSASKAVEDAERAIVRANRSLDQAADKTDRAGSSTMTAAANLDFLLSQLSPAERRLYEALNKTYETYKKIFQGTGTGGSGIYGVIIDSFTRAVDRANEIMQMPDVVKTVQGLANSIGSNINKALDSFTDAEGIGQLQGIIEDATKNLSPLVDMAIDLGHAFLNIAETANPAFQDLIKYVGPIVERFLALTGNKDKMEDFFSSGEKHLEAWLDLVFAVVRLFAVLIGASADDGKKSVEDLTKLIDGWTDKLEKNGDKVRDFFRKAREGAFEILGVFENLAKTLFQSFDEDTLSNFADILNNSVIPALGGVIRQLGRITGAVSKVLDTKAGAEFAKYALAFLFFGQIMSSTLGAFGLFFRLARGLRGVVGEITKGFRLFGSGIKALVELGGRLKFAGEVANAMAGKVTILGKAFIFLGRALTFMLGPWGIVIGLLVVGIVLLLKHFDKLDDVWRGMKAAFKIFTDAIQPALKSLQDALKDVGLHVDSFKDVLGGLEAAGKVVADFITVVLVESFKGLAHVIAGVAIVIIRTITGIINIVHGFVDIFIGLFKIFSGDGEGGKQLLKGLEEVAKGIVDIMGGVVEGIVQVFEGLIDIFLAPFKAAWEAVKGFFGVHSPSTLAADLGRDIIHGLVAGAKSAVRALGRLAGWAWDKIRDGFHALGGAIRRLAGWVIDKYIDFLKLEIRGLKNIGTWIWNAIKDSVRAVGGLAKGIASWLWDKFTGFLKREIQGFKNIGTWIFHAMSDAIHGIGDRLEDIGKRIIDALIRGIKKAPKAIADAIDWLLDKVPGGGALKKGLKVIGDAERAVFAEGGPVPGSGSGDTVKALLTPGEHVLTKGEVEAAGGHAAIFALRALLGGGRQSFGGGFRDGGAVGPGAGITLAFEGGGVSDFQQKWRSFWADISTTARRGANYIEAQFRDMEHNTAKSADKMYRDVRGSLADIQKSFDVRGNTIVKGWSKDWLDLMQVAYDGLFYIGHETNRALTAMGEKHIDYKLTPPQKKDGKAGGGWIGSKGQRGKDGGLYPLGAGEAVLNWAHQSYVEPAMNAFYGHGLGEMFGRVRGFHAGGPGQTGFAAGRAPQFAPIPGMPGEEANTRIVPLLVKLIRQYHAIVTDAYDRDHSAGHKSPGHNVTGTAADMVPGPGGSWNLIEAMGKWAVSKGMIVGYGAGVPGSQPWPGHGRGNHIHIEFGSNPSAAGAAMEPVAQIARRIVTPRGTATARLVQAAVDRVRKAANNKLSETFPATEGGATDFQGGKGALSVGQFAGVVRQALSILNIKTGIGDWVRTMTRQAQHESSLNPNARNDTPAGRAAGGPKGILQVVDGTFNAYKVAGHGNVFNALDNTLASIKYVVSRYGGGNAARAVSALWARGGGAYAQGGIIDGPDGFPVPIVGHAGEWVLNKGQQLRAAMLTGMSRGGLRDALGFSGGPTNYQGGGEIGRGARILGVGDSLAVGIQAALKNTFRHLKESVREGISSGEALRRLKENWKSAYRAVIFDAGTNDSQAKTFARNLKRAHKIVDSDQELIVSTLKGGPQAAAKNRALRKFARENENVRVVDTSGIPLGPDNLHPTAAGYRQRAQLFRQAIRQGGPTAADASRVPVPPVTTLRTLMADVSDTWKGITEISRVMRKVKGDKIKQGDAKKVGNEYQEIIGLIDNIVGEAGIGAIAEQISARVNRAAAHLKRITYQVKGGKVSQVLSTGGILNRELATLVANTHDLVGEKSVILDSLKTVNKQIKKIYGDRTITNKQRDKLIQQLVSQRNGLLAEQDRINSEIADSIETRFNKQIEIQQNAVDAINKRHEQTGKGLDLSKRIFAALGNQDMIQAINKQISDNLVAQANELEARISKARARGATDLADQLQDQVNDLRVQIFEAAQQAIRDSVDAVNQAASRRLGRLDLFGRMADAMGVVSSAVGVNVGGEVLSRAGVSAARGAALQTQRAGLQGALIQAQGQGNVGLIQDLTDQLADLSVSIQENSRATFQAKIDEATQSSDFDLSINDLNKQLQDSKDALTGVADASRALILANERGTLLGQRQIDLLALQQEAISRGDVKAQQDLQKALLENQIAINGNTKAINDATGAGSAPASYTSTAWQWFRSAFLTGTGGVMPQYTSPVMADVSSIGPGGGMSSTTTNNGASIANYFEINEAGQPIDATKLASTVVFAQSTAH
jgi:hypothetical protein